MPIDAWHAGRMAYSASEDESIAVSNWAYSMAAQIVAKTCSTDDSPRSRPLATTAPAVSMSGRHGHQYRILCHDYVPGH